VGRRGLEPRT